MTRVANTRPPTQKVPRLPPDPVRLAKVRALPCVICYHWGHTQRSPTEAHHCKSGRYSTRKVADRYTIPLCHSHHNKLWPIPGDEDKIGFHNAQKVWEAEYGPDHDWIAWTDDMIEADASGSSGHRPQHQVGPARRSSRRGRAKPSCDFSTAATATKEN